jgi:hypothetical protein
MGPDARLAANAPEPPPGRSPRWIRVWPYFISGPVSPPRGSKPLFCAGLRGALLLTFGSGDALTDPALLK